LPPPRPGAGAGALARNSPNALRGSAAATDDDAATLRGRGIGASPTPDWADGTKTAWILKSGSCAPNAAVAGAVKTCGGGGGRGAVGGRRRA